VSQPNTVASCVQSVHHSLTILKRETIQSMQTKNLENFEILQQHEILRCAKRMNIGSRFIFWIDSPLPNVITDIVTNSISRFIKGVNEYR
jgi:hypothetical protein